MDKILYLDGVARELRKNIIKMIYISQSGHPGGSLSAADIMTTLYFDEMKVCPDQPSWEDRDRFILSKGHTCPVMYATLAMKGYFDIETLWTLRKMGSILQGHPYMKKVPGVDMTTGSLGQGLSVSVGMSLGLKHDKRDSRVFVLIGDGETQEGQVWEAAMSAAKYKLNNLVAIIDKNRIQNDDFVEKIMPIDPLDKKWEAFGWNVVNCDGHDIASLLNAFELARKETQRPSCIIAATTKGKGVSFMENEPKWHGMAPDKELYEKAIEELGGAA